MRRWEIAFYVLVLALILALQLARELYLDSHARPGWSDEPGTFDPSKVKEE